MGRQRRRRVAEFTGVEHAGGETGQLLEQVGAHLGRVATGAAGQDLDPLHPGVDVVAEGQGHQATALGQMAGHPQGRGFRLLVDLLEHEVAEAALVRHVLGAAEQGGRALHPAALGVVELDAQGREQGHLAVLKGQDRAGEAGQGGGVAGAEELPLAQADQQGRGLAGHHQGAGQLRPEHRQGIGAMQPRQHRLQGLQQQGTAGGTTTRPQPFQLAAEQVRNHLGVGLGTEHDTLGLQLLAQNPVVLDDAVLHHRHPARAIEVGMGVALLRLAVGGPAGVTDAAQARGAGGLEALAEIDELALGPQAVQATGGSAGRHLNGGDASGVVAAVFQLAQALQQQRRRLARADHRNDAAHKKNPAEPGLSLWEEEGPTRSASERGDRAGGAQ